MFFFIGRVIRELLILMIGCSLYNTRKYFHDAN